MLKKANGDLIEKRDVVLDDVSPADREAFNKQGFLIFNKDDVSRTKQSFVKEADINVLMKRYIKDGFIPQVIGEPMYGNFTSGNDLYDVSNRIAEANSRFMELPAEVRNKFHNNCSELINFMSNPDNEVEGVALGLFKQPDAVFDNDGKLIPDKFHAIKVVDTKPIEKEPEPVKPK